MAIDGSTELAAGRRILAAVAFADIVNYSGMMAADEVRTHAIWMSILRDNIRPCASRHAGTVVKSTGDGVLARFDSALDAIRWAEEVQADLRARIETAEDGAPHIQMRIAIHLGDIVAEEGDIYGDGVNVAARLQEHAAPGGVVMSEAVHDVVRGSVGARAADLGQRQLKGFDKPVRIYALLQDQTPAIPAPRRAHLPSIAVLPLRNLGGDADDDYLADGIVEDIIVSLAGLGELFVISRGSTMMFRNRDADPREVGRALGVRYVVTGTLRRSSRQLRVGTQLTDTATGATLWTKTADTALGDVFDMQDSIVERIVAGIAPNVRTSELRAALRKRPDSFSAYDHMLRALHLMYDFDAENFRAARASLTQAMTEDPLFAMPYAIAAWWHVLNVGQGHATDATADVHKAGDLAWRALALDAENALALSISGHVKSFLFHDYDVAALHLARAIESGPSCALAWTFSAATKAYCGEAEEAIRHAEHAVRLSPLDRTLFFTHNILCIAHYVAGNFREAAHWGRLSRSESPNFSATYRILIASLVACGEADEARAMGLELLRLEPGFSVGNWQARRLPFRDPDVRHHYAARLREAGLPD